MSATEGVPPRRAFRASARGPPDRPCPETRKTGPPPGLQDGPNGSGKTTTLRSLLGLVTPTGGSATIDGSPYSELAAPLHVVGAMLEATAHPTRSARGHLRVLAAAS